MCLKAQTQAILLSPPQEGKARAWEREDGGSLALLELPLLSCQPGRAGTTAGQASLVCWRHLPWKPEALRPGPLFPGELWPL